MVVYCFPIVLTAQRKRGKNGYNEEIIKKFHLFISKDITEVEVLEEKGRISRYTFTTEK